MRRFSEVHRPKVFRWNVKCDCVFRRETCAYVRSWSFEMGFLEVLCVLHDMFYIYCRLLPRTSRSLRSITYSFFGHRRRFTQKNAQYFTTSNKIINSGLNTSWVRVLGICITSSFLRRRRHCWLQGIRVVSLPLRVHIAGRHKPEASHQLRHNQEPKTFFSLFTSSSSFVCVILCRLYEPAMHATCDAGPPNVNRCSNHGLEIFEWFTLALWSIERTVCERAKSTLAFNAYRALYYDIFYSVLKFCAAMVAHI